MHLRLAWNMQVKTWLQRLTDESSLWFNAVKAEDNGDMISAASFYLKDALKSAKGNSLVREALSCSCAANCLLRCGNAQQARHLYGRAAKLYFINARKVISSSIREATWSLREAYENYILADQEAAANAVQFEYLSLATRVNPFSDATEVQSELAAIRSSAMTLQKGQEIPVPADLEAELSSVLAQEPKIPTKSSVDSDSISVIKSLDLSGGIGLDEKGIAS
jgi:hypothetical protein